MNKISLRWRITITMGILVLLASILLTVFSIQNATNNFIMPLMYPSVNMELEKENQNIAMQHDVANNLNLPDGTFYTQEIDMTIENAKQSFSTSSYLCMAIVTIGSMIIAYYLAGHAMQPISKMNREISLIENNTLSKRVSVVQTKDEIENLALSFNGLLERLEQGFEREKQFSANVAHELKTPLATIITSAQVLKLNDQTTIEEYRENMDITLQSAKRLTEVVEGLLMLCRKDRELSIDVVDSREIFYEIQKELSALYSDKKLDIKYDLNIDTLEVNYLLIYRAFFNLIENAHKYAEQNGKIAISSHVEGNNSVFCISNTGMSISKEDIKHIFEPFYRADKSRARKIAGAGLGLAIAKEIFNIHNATITIDSEKSNGTIVEVRFKKS